jgi:hypothetical protein
LELFLDNDIILKLSTANLLEEIEEIYNTDKSKIFVLPSAYFYFKKNKKLKEKYGEETIERAKEAAKKYSKIPDEYINNEKFQQLGDLEKIDSGEQLLFSLSPKTQNFYILTGDKNSIIALNNSNEIDEIKMFLKNKIMFLEELMLSVIGKGDFDSILHKMKVSNFCFDKVLKNCFNQTNVTRVKVVDCLYSYTNDLKSSCKVLYN